MMRAALSSIFFAIAMAIAGAASAAPPIPSRLAQFQAQDRLLQDIGWRLARGNASYCGTSKLGTGLQLQDMRSYGSPDMVRHALGLNGDFAVASAARGSPAQLAGLLTNQEVEAVAGQHLSAWPAKERLDPGRQVRAQDAIDLALAQNGSVSIILSGGQTVDLRGLPVCATRFELDNSGDHAVALGQRVIVGADFPGFDYPEDELAAAIAHEAAHNWLRHRAWLDANGRKQKNVRLTEREADRLTPWLLANAGYDSEAAVRFMQRWGPRHDGGFLRKRTHDGWDERAEAIALEISIVQQRMAGAGVVDWHQFFQREVKSAGVAQSTSAE